MAYAKINESCIFPIHQHGIILGKNIEIYLQLLFQYIVTCTNPQNSFYRLYFINKQSQKKVQNFPICRNGENHAGSFSIFRRFFSCSIYGLIETFPTLDKHFVYLFFFIVPLITWKNIQHEIFKISVVSLRWQSYLKQKHQSNLA